MHYFYISNDASSTIVSLQDKAIAEEQVRLVKRQQERIQKLKKVSLNCFTAKSN